MALQYPLFTASAIQISSLFCLLAEQSIQQTRISLPVFTIDHRQPFQQQIIIQYDLPPAVRYDLIGQTAGCDHSRFTVQFFREPVDDAVNSGS